MRFDALFPQPKQITEFDQVLDLAGRPVQIVTDDDSRLVQNGAKLLAQGRVGVGDPYHIDLRVGAADPAWPDGANREEAYTLDLRPDGGRLDAATPAGAFLGCQTLRQLLQATDHPRSAVRITDWPDLRFRGLYVESKWGPDLMTLADWQALIDDLASRKFNSLGIGVYGCWIVQYGGKRTEFLMLPFPNHPRLITPKTLRYYSPQKGAWQTLDYLPRMVTDDLFGKIVIYGKEHNVIVRPHFNSPGHNTVIPQVYPEVSSRDEAGNPVGYGFCLSNPRTYELLFELYDSVIERYLRPNGVDWFHMGLDEVEAYVGIDEQNPARRVEPWCQCPACRDKPRGQQLQEYAIRVCTHLKEQGINQITMWNDALSKLGALNDDFVRMLDRAGLRDHVIVQWWRYNEPVLVPNAELGLRAWSTPMAGYWSNLFSCSYTSNIYGMLLHGGRAGIEGADAYCIYDPAYDRNYACLAEFSWNQPATEDLYGFKSRYARAKLGQRLDPHLAAEAFDRYDQAFDSMPWSGSVLSSLLYYWHSYPAARLHGDFPRDVLTDLPSSHMRLRQALSSAATHARTARDLLVEANGDAADPILAEYWVECDKLVGVWETFVQIVDAVGAYEAGVQREATGAEARRIAREAASSVAAAQARLTGVMADLERVKQPYLLPQILRDMSVIRLYIELLAKAFSVMASTISEAEPSTRLVSFQELSPRQAELDTFVSMPPKSSEVTTT